MNIWPFNKRLKEQEKHYFSLIAKIQSFNQTIDDLDKVECRKMAFYLREYDRFEKEEDMYKFIESKTKAETLRFAKDMLEQFTRTHRW